MALDKKKVKKLIALMNSSNLVEIPPMGPIIECFEIAMDQQTVDYLLTLGIEPHTVPELKAMFCEQFKNDYHDLDAAWNSQWAKIKEWSLLMPLTDGERWELASIFPGWIELGTSGPSNPKRDAVTKSFMKFWKLLHTINVAPVRALMDKQSLKEITEGPGHMGVIPTTAKAGAKAKREAEAAKAEAIARGENPRRVELNAEITSEQQVLTANSVFELLDKVGDDVAVMNCICRRHAQMEGKGECGMHIPVESCMAFGTVSKHLVANGVARQLTHDEAWDMLEEFERQGCIHTTYHYSNNAENDLMVVCNCCTDCCLLYGGWQQGYISKIGVKALSMPVTVCAENCTGCNLCGKYCPTYAIHFDDELGEVVFNPEKCIGCGQCVTQCRFGVREMEDNVRNVFVPSLNKKGR